MGVVVGVVGSLNLPEPNNPKEVASSESLVSFFATSVDLPAILEKLVCSNSGGGEVVGGGSNPSGLRVPGAFFALTASTIDRFLGSGMPGGGLSTPVEEFRGSGMPGGGVIVRGSVVVGAVATVGIVEGVGALAPGLFANTAATVKPGGVVVRGGWTG